MTDADVTEADVARLAEMLPRWPRYCDHGDHLARHLLEQGVTLPPSPPDPAVVVAEALRHEYLGYGARLLNPDEYPSHARFIAAVRDLFTTEALAAAAAKVQEADPPTVKCPVWCVRPKGHDGDHLAIPAGSDRSA